MPKSYAYFDFNAIALRNWVAQPLTLADQLILVFEVQTEPLSTNMTWISTCSPSTAFSSANDNAWLRVSCPPFQANQKYTATIQVRRDKVRGLINGKVFHEVARNDARLGAATNWYGLRDYSHLAFCCDDPTVFESLYVVEVSGPGKVGR